MSRTTADGVADYAAYCGFLVLFPGFVVYQYAVSSGWMPAFLGGLFGLTSVAIAPISLVCLAVALHGRGGSEFALERLFAFLTTYLFLWTAIEGLTVANRGYAGDAVKESLVTLCIWIAVFFVGFRIQLASQARYVGLMISFAMLAGVLLLAIASHESILGPLLAFQGGDDSSDVSGGVATYQGVGRSILVTAIVCASLHEKLWKQTVVLFLAALGLLLLGSRAHLFGCVAVIAALTCVSVTKRRDRNQAMVLLVALFVAGYALSDLFMGSRASEVLDLGESTSWQGRLDLQSRALEVVRESPFLGEFGYHHRAGPLAGYAHNILSAWAGFGVVAFCLYAGMIVYALFVSARNVLTPHGCTPLWLIAFQLNLVAALLALMSEPIYSSVFPALAWGFTANAVRHDRQRSAWSASVNGSEKIDKTGLRIGRK